ncbi:30S ribosomal protein S21 [archaeon]|nr:30S ribosomal protein S21 [archaeon]
MEEALRRFKKKVEEAQILETFRNNQFFEKPSVVKRRKKKARIALNKRTGK